MITPPAACMAAVEPVEVHTHIPLDHTLIDIFSEYSGRGLKEGATLPVHSDKRNRETAAGIGCAIRISLRAGGNRVSTENESLHQL